MKKSILLVGASIALAATMVVGGTLAYFTDDEKKVNVSTTNPVDVVLIEEQRNADGTALEPFEQGKELLPLVGSAQGTKDKWGMPTDTNYVDKIVSVQNKDTSSDAYVRVLVAIPTVLFGDSLEDGSDDILHYNFGNRVFRDGKYEGDSNPNWSNWNWQDGEPVELYYVEIDGIEYCVDTYTYTKPLAAGEIAEAAICGYYLDSSVNWDDETSNYSRDGKEIDFDLSTVMIPVAAEAIQASAVVDKDGDGVDIDEITAAFVAEGYGHEGTLANGKATGYNLGLIPCPQL